MAAPNPRGADEGHRTMRGGHSPLERRNTAPTVGMKLVNIEHFHRSRLLRLFEPAGMPRLIHDFRRADPCGPRFTRLDKA